MTEAEELELLELEEEEASLSQRPAAMRADDAGARGFVQGGTLGFGDELAGAITEGVAKVSPDAARWLNTPVGQDVDPSAPASYAGARDLYRGLNKQAKEQHPAAYTVPEVAAGIGVTRGIGSGATLGRAVATGAGLGAVGSAGLSEAEDAGGVLVDTAVGMAGGGLLGAAGHGIGRLASGVQSSRPAQWIRGKIAGAELDAEKMAIARVDKAIASAQGKYRGKVQEASRDLEVLLREAQEGVGEAAQAARDFLATPQAAQMRDAVLKNKLISAPERLADVEALKAQWAELAAGREGAVRQGASDLLADPVQNQVWPRVKRYASRAIAPVVGSYIGSEAGEAIGGDEGRMIGTGVGAGVGFMAGAAMGAPGTSFANAMKSPGVRKAAWEGVKSATVDMPERLVNLARRVGPVGRPILEAMQRGGAKALAVADFILTEQDPRWRQAKAEAAGQQ